MIDLAKFCHESRENLTLPWSAGEFSYATDSYVLIRVPRREDVPERPKAPNAAPLLTPFDFSKLAPAPVVKAWPKIKTTYCYHCNGDGQGCRCEHCQCKCEYCGGGGEQEVRATAVVCGEIVQVSYMKLLWQLPGLRIGPPAKPLSPLPFAADGDVIGVLMPCKSKMDEHFPKLAATPSDGLPEGGL